MDCKYKDQINDYLEDSLDENKKIEFEEFLNNNSDFKELVDDIQFNDKLLKKEPKVVASSDFIINLNKRINKYERKKNIFYIFDLLRKNIFQTNPIPAFGVFALFIIISFSIFKISDINFRSNFNNLSNGYFDTSMAVNDQDSLQNINNDTPILLFGNEK